MTRLDINNQLEKVVVKHY